MRANSDEKEERNVFTGIAKDTAHMPTYSHKRTTRPVLVENIRTLTFLIIYTVVHLQ